MQQSGNADQSGQLGEMQAGGEAERRRSALSLAGRMADWRNDDLLITASQRELLEIEFPGALGVFDFSGLRELFDGFDRRANQSRRRRQKAGLLAITLGGLGAALAAILPIAELMGATRAPFLFAISAMLSLGGLIWALGLTLVDPHKEEWLHNRLRTERLRQFYFQFLLSDPALAARAMMDAGRPLKAWKAKQETALRGFKAWLDKPMRSELTALKEDVNDCNVWFFEGWGEPQIPDDPPQMDTYFAILRRQRIEVQRAYVREKLAFGWGSPETRLKVSQALSWTFTILTALLTTGTAIMLLGGTTTRDIAFSLAMSAIALLGVLSIYIRVVAEGLHLRGDTERYRWYDAAIDDADARFYDPAPSSRLDALKAMEKASYRELREFLSAHEGARFNFA